ncbi:peptidyl-prolyl cis-trans isomerase [Alloalcanivorax marinus]|uniref:peptidyl-prolyl cis-trans isomerase n=1 Tax=Alloalcanivorax marinus TaxID=1177169 RepID=UPI00195EA0DD|nr:peptidylprolyl isomerase [Alloalcanivorax marinus]MBM7335429.1 peptidyl-prolyl cis-trans isomerase [Alloalcanivorax marinus]
MKRFCTALMAGAACLWAALAVAAPSASETVARVDGKPLSARVLSVFVATARVHEPDIDARRVLENLVDVHLMGEWFREVYAEDTPAPRVGYDRTALARRDLAALTRVAWRAGLAETLAAWEWSSPLRALSAPPRLDDPALAAILTPRPGLRLGFDAAQQAAAEQWVLARYRFPGAAPRTLTLARLYRAQNVALKTRFHNLDRAAMQGAVEDYVRRAFVLDWFERRAPLDDADRAWIRQLVLDRQDQRALLLALGLSDDPHDDNPLLAEVAAGIPAREIARYYQYHRDQFVRVEKVRAARLWLPTPALAEDARRRLAEGATLETLVAAYGERDGVRYQAPAWLARGRDQDAWLTGFAFAQTPGLTAPPIRAPGESDRWVVVRVDERVEGYQAADSESVRYQASRALARTRLRQHLETGLARRQNAAAVRFYSEAL